MMTEFVTLDADNVDAHHLCCALGDPKHRPGVEAKRAWLKRRFREGLVFRKLDARGKVFIEYAPSEKAWRPIVAPGWITIHCLWVSGSYAKQGHGGRLLTSCLDDARAQGKAGVVVAVGRRKRPFLGDAKFFARFDFEVVDEAGEFVLMARRFDPEAPPPRFAPAVRREDDGASGPFVARYTDQCPLNAHWAEQMAGFVREAGYDVSVERITRRAVAQRVASPLGTFGLEQGGALVTHHLNTENAVRRLLDRRG